MPLSAFETTKDPLLPWKMRGCINIQPKWVEEEKKDTNATKEGNAHIPGGF